MQHAWRLGKTAGSEAEHGELCEVADDVEQVMDRRVGIPFIGRMNTIEECTHQLCSPPP